jgi:hypothetical protein
MSPSVLSPGSIVDFPPKQVFYKIYPTLFWCYLFKEVKSAYQRDICKPAFIAAWFKIAEI